MLINCDIGERGIAHETDDTLMSYIDIANIACGAHAGCRESVAYYLGLAEKLSVTVSAHLSYPDRENFGRKVMEISDKALLNSLDEQYALLSHAERVKLHGALYNLANVDESLARLIAQWFKTSGVREVLTQHGSCLDKACEALDIHVIHEAFLDRRYVLEENVLKLASRERADALITDPDDALRQYACLTRGHVEADGQNVSLRAKTLCVHSDSHGALEILKKLRDV